MSKQLTVKLTDQQYEALGNLSHNRSEGVRALIESSATVWAKQAQPAHGTNDISEYSLVTVPHLTAESEGMRGLELFMAASQAGISADLTLAPSLNVGQSILEAAKEEQQKVQAALTGGEPKRDSFSTTTVNNPVVIDPTIRAMMQLAEFYCISEGDLWQTILVPLEVGFQDYDIPTGEEGARREARAYLESIDAHRVVEELWLARQSHGQSYAIEVRDSAHTTGVVVPNSKHIAVGREIGLSPRNSFAYVPSSLSTAQALLKAPPSFVLSQTVLEWNEAQLALWGVPLDPDAVTQICVPKYAQNFYAIPPLARASRAIDSRRFLEEMARATIEGVKNQLWLFKLENPRPGEAKLLSDVLAGARGARTGYLVWGANLDVSQFIPQSVDQLLAPEATWNFTMKVYRDLGISIRLISGEAPNATARSDSTVDVDVALDRLMYSRAPFERFLQKLVNREIGLDRNGQPLAQVRLADVSLKVSETIKTRVIPMMNYGVLSPTTALSMSGMNADAEKRQIVADDEFRTKYIRPYSGFGQDGPTGTAQHTEPGRPVGKVETQPRQSAQAAQEIFASVESDYEAAVRAAWDKFVAGEKQAKDEGEKRVLLDGYIATMLDLAGRFRPLAYQAGYRAQGGAGAPDPFFTDKWTTFDLANLEDFRNDLAAAIALGKDLSAFTARALLYSEMGYRMAFTGGVFQVKREEGATGWRRILHPAASKSGPCAVCVADARIVHPMSVDFFDHPQGVCGMQFISFYHSEFANGEVVKIPVVELP